MRLTRFFGVVTAAAVLWLVPNAASAGVIRFSTANCGGFSSCNDASFVAGAGVPLIFEDFLLTGVNGPVLGNAYSTDFTLSSTASGVHGGVTTAFVQHASGDTPSSEVGPSNNGSFNGILNIDFASSQSAVGLGTVELGNHALEWIRVYNGATLLGQFAPISGATFNYEGFVANGGDVITRIELEGTFFAIQNMQYTSVPEPGALLLFGSGLAFAMRRRKARR